jgi:hypothetical protein
MQFELSVQLFTSYAPELAPSLDIEPCSFQPSHAQVHWLSDLVEAAIRTLYFYSFSFGWCSRLPDQHTGIILCTWTATTPADFRRSMAPGSEANSGTLHIADSNVTPLVSADSARLFRAFVLLIKSTLTKLVENYFNAMTAPAF